jgi:hypothetical protein
MKSQISNVRVSFQPVFLEIIKENHAKILRLDARVKKIENDLTKESPEYDSTWFERRIQALENELANASLVVVVFSAIATEAYIYDYAARHLGDTYVKKHLDKLDTLSKWIIIPRLVTGREIPRNENWHGLLTNLIKTRNSVVHYKSSEPPVLSPDAKKYFEKQQADSKILLDTAKEALALLEALADKITEVDPEEAPWVKSYLA